MDEVEKEVIQACKETAKSFRSTIAERTKRNQMILSFIRSDKTTLHERLIQLLGSDP